MAGSNNQIQSKTAGIQAGNINISSGNVISSTNTNGNISIDPNGTGAPLLNGASTYINTGFVSGSNYIGSTQAVLPYATIRLGNSAPSAAFMGFNTRSTSVGSFSSISTGDPICRVVGFADDGTSFVEAGLMQWVATGAISTGIVPSSWNVYTSNTSGARTLALTISSTQVSTFSGQVIAPSFSPSSTSGIIGTTTNNNAASGSVGEFASYEGAGSDVLPVDGSVLAIFSLSLLAGDWDVWSNVYFVANGSVTGIGTVSAAISTSNTVMPSTNITATWDFTGRGSNTPSQWSLTVPMVRMSLSTTTTVYVVGSGYATGSGAAINMNGFLYARRRR